MSKVTFAVMTDLHYEHVPDGLQRLEALSTGHSCLGWKSCKRLNPI